jgi:hypothetical protein
MIRLTAFAIVLSLASFVRAEEGKPVQLNFNKLVIGQVGLAVDPRDVKKNLFHVEKVLSTDEVLVRLSTWSSSTGKIEVRT